MNREILTLSEKLCLRLSQCNPSNDAAEDSSITTASTGIYRLMLSIHIPASAPATVTLNLYPELFLQQTLIKPIRVALESNNLNAIMH